MTTTKDATAPSRFIGKPEMLDRVAASYPTVWQWMRDGKFPRSRELEPFWIEITHNLRD